MNFYFFSVLRWSAARCIQLDSSNRRQNVIVSVIDRSVWSASLQLRAVLMRQTFSSCALCKQICSNDRKSRMIWAVCSLSDPSFDSAVLPGEATETAALRSPSRVCKNTTLCPALWMFVGLLWPCELFCRLCPRVLCFSMCFCFSSWLSFN